MHGLKTLPKYGKIIVNNHIKGSAILCCFLLLECKGEYDEKDPFRLPRQGLNLLR